MNTIKHTEYIYNGRRVILDTCELAQGKYETMLLYPNGHEIACRTARTEADAIAFDAAAQVADGGTCNLDAPSLLLPRWQSAKVKQACEEAGGDYFRWGYSNRYVICLRLPGQANKRETAAEVMTKALADMGYDALTYCAID